MVRGGMMAVAMVAMSAGVSAHAEVLYFRMNLPQNQTLNWTMNSAPTPIDSSAYVGYTLVPVDYTSGPTFPR